MQPDPISATADTIQEETQESMKKGKECLSSCCDSIRTQSCQLCESTSELVRKHPLSAVVGAAFFGAAVCYLILEGRSQATFKDRYFSGSLSDASDSARDSLRSAYDSFKFW